MCRLDEQISRRFVDGPLYGGDSGQDLVMLAGFTGVRSSINPIFTCSSNHKGKNCQDYIFPYIGCLDQTENIRRDKTMDGM